MSAKRRILKYLDRNRTIELLKALVRSPSVNPPGKEQECAEIIARWLRKVKVDVELSAADPHRPNVIGKLRGKAGGPILLFNGHMDVVPPGHGWTYSPFSGKVVGKRLYGRGSVDMKAGLVAMIMALEALKKAKVNLHGELIVTAVVDEEAGSMQGTRHLIKEGLKADMAIVGEPTNMRVEIANKGILWTEITTSGRSSHAARPHLGINAIMKMNRVIQALQDVQFEVKNDIFDVPLPTLTVCFIQGGTKVNVVPDYCKIEVDRRLFPGEAPTKAYEEIEEILDKLKHEDPELEIQSKVLYEWPPMEISPEEPIVQALQKAVTTITHQDPQVAGKAAGTDASFLVNTAKIPTVLFGPGDPRQSHTPDEHVNVDQVFNAAQVFTLVAYDILNQQAKRKS
jgi:acetylornithine deacetylase/succinyl-diaminopimelate desuccinylase family protein